MRFLAGCGKVTILAAMFLTGCSNANTGSVLPASASATSQTSTSAPQTTQQPSEIPTPFPYVIPSGKHPIFTLPLATPMAVPTPALAVAISFYSYADNAPSGTDIAYPHTSYPAAIHNSAGGTGTYADPVTLSSNIAEFPIGTRLYIASLQKYFVMEDDCPGCDQTWSTNQSHSAGIWIGGNSSSSATILSACENTLQTLVNTNGASAYVNPPASGLTVDTTPLFNTASDTCY